MMKRIVLIFIIATNFAFIFGQITLVYEGTTVKNTTTGAWVGVNVPRSVPTLFTYKNNSITSSNSSGYMLQAGDEAPLPSNNSLDGEVITGNKINWNGVNNSSIITHGLFAGYNINSVVKYNYLENVPYGIIFKSGTDAGVNMTFTTGGCAYNIWKNGKFAGRVKGINGIKFYNNTFYSGDGGGWYLLLISTNMDRIVPAGSKDTKVINNIFYSTKQIPMIEIYDNASLSGFQSDYNIYYCEAGEPIFNIAGVTKTWTEWRALGYDTHSVIKNPDFLNTTDFVPRVRLDYGSNLGIEWQTGLSTTATWVAGSSPTTTNQNGTWQVGARIYESGTKEAPVTIKMTISPNHVNKIMNILLEYSVSITTQTTTLSPEIIRVVDLSGKLYIEQLIDTGVANIQIPINLMSGIYTVSLSAGGLVMTSQKMIVY